MIEELCGVRHTLIGFRNNKESGKGSSFNLILSNGAQSTQGEVNTETRYTHMIPADAFHKMRSLTIHYNPDYHIHGSPSLIIIKKIDSRVRFNIG
jgi:hypothetical protein